MGENTGINLNKPLVSSLQCWVVGPGLCKREPSLNSCVVLWQRLTVDLKHLISKSC